MSTTDNQTQLVKSLLKVYQNLPKWAKIILSVAMSVCVATMLLAYVGCGTYAQVDVRSETPGNLNVSISQPRHDSSTVNVQINPTFTIPYSISNGKKNETEERQ